MKTLLIILLALATGCQDAPVQQTCRPGEFVESIAPDGTIKCAKPLKLGTPIYSRPQLRGVDGVMLDGSVPGSTPAPVAATWHYDCGTRGGADGNTAYCNKYLK